MSGHTPAGPEGDGSLSAPPSPEPRTIDARLRRALERAGVTAREAALRIGLDHHTLQRWCLGVHRPSPKFRSYLESLEKVLDTPPGLLAGWLDESRAAEPLLALPTFAERLSAARRRAGLRLAVLARRSGVPEETLRLWSNGATNPSADTHRGLIPVLEEILDTPVGYLESSVTPDEPGEEPATFSGRLRRALKRSGLSGNEAARRAGINDSSFSIWYRGVYLPARGSEERIAELERVLGTRPGYLTELLDVPVVLDPLPTFGERLTLARRRAGLSLEAAARLVGVGAKTMFSWCAGENLPSKRWQKDLISELERALDTPAGYLADALAPGEPAEEPVTFADRLAFAVDRSGLTKKEICKRARLHPLTLANWSRGERVPIRKFRPAVTRLEEVLGLEPGYLAFEKPFVEPKEEPDTFAGRLDVARQRAGLTYYGLGQLVGVKAFSIRHWCSGEWLPRRLDPERVDLVVAELEKVLDLAPGYLSSVLPPPFVMPADGEDPEAFKDRLRVARRRARLSPKQLGALAKVSRGTIAAWECGKTTPRPEDLRTVSKLERLEQALGTPPGYLGSGAGPDDSPAADPSTFVGRFRLALRRSGLWAYELARRAGLPGFLVYTWYTGKHRPSLRYASAIETIERLLETEPGYLRALLPPNMRGDMQTRSYTSSLTYTDLRARVQELGAKSGKSKANVDNHLSALRQWQRVHGLPDDAYVGAELDGDFDARSAEFERVRKAEVREDTAAEQVSRLRWIRDVCVEEAPLTFAERLQMALKFAPVTRHAAAIAVGLSQGAVRKWALEGLIPSASSLPAVRQLEVVLGTPTGFLTDVLPANLRGGNPPRYGMNRYGKQTMRAHVGFYSAWNDRVEAEFAAYAEYKSTDGPKAVLREAEEDVHDGWSLNSLGRRPSEEMARGKIRAMLGFACLPEDDGQAVARVRAAHEALLTVLDESARATWAAGDEAVRVELLLALKDAMSEADRERFVDTADVYLRACAHGVERAVIEEMASDIELAWAVRSYVVAALEHSKNLLVRVRRRIAAAHKVRSRILADTERDRRYWRGLGREVADATMAWLADRSVIEAYLEFRFLRSENRFSKHHELVITTLTPLLRKKTGWLWRRADLRSKLDPDLSERQWHDHCKAVRKYLLSVLVRVKPLSVMSRSHDRIAGILEAEKPIDALLDVADKALDDCAKERYRREGAGLSSPTLKEARLYRDALLVLFVTSNPLRALQFSTMQWGRHLYQKEDGSWWLKFDRSEFKNRKALKKDYDVEVNEHLWAYLETYRDVYHPVLSASGAALSHVFVSVRPPRSAQPFTPESISDRFEVTTSRYTPSGTGFRLHSARHIVATDIIKSNPEWGMMAAARALHDRQRTVEKAYTHLRTHEERRPADRHFSVRYKAKFGSRSAAVATLVRGRGRAPETRP